MMLHKCIFCTKTFESDELQTRGSVCFKCHVGSVHIGFSNGRAEFSGPTVKERQDEILRDAAAAGREVEPVTNWM